jgi:hypothetical protein
MSLYKRSKVIRSPKYIEKKRKIKILLSVLFPISILSVLSALILFIRSDFFIIDQINISGSSDTNKVLNEVNNLISGNYIKILPKSNIVIFPKQDIASTTKSLFKEIETISIHRSGISSISIDIKEKTPIAILCDGFEGDNDIKCFLIDFDGFAYKQVQNTNYSNLNKYYTTALTDSDILGKKFLEPSKLKEFDDFIKGISKIGIIPMGILINDGGQYEMYIEDTLHQTKNASSTPVTIYMNDKISLSKILYNFQVFWKNYQNTVKNSKPFDYIDMRFGNTVFYATK